ncbi:ABC transporter substrate-binding protein [Paenibacillus odorifer]|uniref:ABC transporter substrate-binding protein n=1 Tax=Paenibacillus odorifer TaxID=189426 RepID=UPI00096D3527|nr:ABC transporter substrate-binding protein [Paenibacillus odorifer]OMD58920.1 ABC transporter substrate-binding protein [Paenibacillus odorifer]
MFSLKQISFVGIALIMMVMLYGCGNSGQEAKVENSQPAVNSEPVATNSTETRTLKDAKGDIVIPVNPVRIADVSGSTEELLVLGYKPVITGNTDMANSLEITPILKKELPDVTPAGWFQTEVNLEAIIAASPDLILAGPTQEKIYDQLNMIAPTVRVPYGFNAFRERFTFVAEVLDKKAEMETWLKAYDQRALLLHDQITEITKEETFAVIEATEKEIRIYSRTGIADMIFNDLGLPLAPGTPEPDPWGGKVTSLEALSTFNPDHIILLSDNDQNVLDQSKVWSNLKAAKSNNIYRMTSRQNYNEAFFALGKEALLEQISEQIKEHIKQ